MNFDWGSGESDFDGEDEFRPRTMRDDFYYREDEAISSSPESSPPIGSESTRGLPQHYHDHPIVDDVDTAISGGQTQSSPEVNPALRSRKKVDDVLSEETLRNDVYYADNILKTNIRNLCILSEIDIFAQENIYFQDNKKVRTLLDLCKPNLQSIQTKSRYKCTIHEGGEIRKKMIHFYFNALVSYEKQEGIIFIESSEHTEMLDHLYSTKVCRDNIHDARLTSCNFVDRMILTLGCLWRQRMQQKQGTDDMTNYSESLGNDTQSEWEASCAPTAFPSVVDDVEALKRSSMKQSEQIDDLAIRVSQLELGESKQSMAVPDGSRSDGTRKRLRVVAAHEITIEEVLDILEDSNVPMTVSEVRNTWQHRFMKNAVSAELPDRTEFKRILYQLLKERKVMKSSGKPYWSIAVPDGSRSDDARSRDAPQEITIEEVLDILEDSNVPMTVSEVRNTWEHRFMKNAVSAELPDRTMFKRILYQLLEERKVMKSSGKPYWSIDKQQQQQQQQQAV
jgi:hypothetical protein